MAFKFNAFQLLLVWKFKTFSSSNELIGFIYIYMREFMLRCKRQAALAPFLQGERPMQFVTRASPTLQPNQMQINQMGALFSWRHSSVSRRRAPYLS